MPVLTRSEFDLWKHHIVTQELFILINGRIEDVKNLLAGSAGLDQNEDNFRRGYITAMNDMLDYYVTFPEEDIDETSPT